MEENLLVIYTLYKCKGVESILMTYFWQYFQYDIKLHSTFKSAWFLLLKYMFCKDSSTLLCILHIVLQNYEELPISFPQNIFFKIQTPALSESQYYFRAKVKKHHILEVKLISNQHLLVTVPTLFNFLSQYSWVGGTYIL